MGKKVATGPTSSHAVGGHGNASEDRDLEDLLTKAEQQLSEEEVIRFFGGFCSSGGNQASLAAPLVEASKRMQERLQEMNNAITSGNSTCLRQIRHASFGRTRGSAPTVSTGETLLATACDLLNHSQKAFTYCQNEMMDAVFESVELAAKQNYAMLRISAKRTNDLQAENLKLSKLIMGLANEVTEVKQTCNNLMADIDAMQLGLNRDSHTVSSVPEERGRGRGDPRHGRSSSSALRLRSVSRASSCDSLSSSLSQISKAKSVARSMRPSMGPAVQFDPVPLPAMVANEPPQNVWLFQQPSLQQIPQRHPQLEQVQFMSHAEHTWVEQPSEYLQPMTAVGMPQQMFHTGQLHHDPWEHQMFAHQMIPLQIFQQDVQAMPSYLQMPVPLPSWLPDLRSNEAM